MADIQTDAVSAVPEPLTDREREILACLVEGMSNQEIAARLYLALRTVKWYNSQIYSKLGVSNRKEAIATGLGLLGVAPDAQKPAPRNNLPIQSTPFVGRQHELASIANQFADPSIKLVTILAPGGMGKTRLALAAAGQQLRNFRDGVFFVPLAPLSSPDEIITTMADNTGFRFYGSAPPRQQLLDYLRDRVVLLVLDNFEHLLDGAPFVADMVRYAPGLRVLTTSRERLNLQGEMVYVLRGLNFPTQQTLERIREYDAANLFVQSARHVRPGFELQSDDLLSLVRICRLTAGMPLAIELAAGWLDTLSLERIGDAIQQGIDILETNLRDVPERHRSVRAAFECTWNRLTDDERAIFGRLSVFRGGFTLPAAQAIAGANARHLRGLLQKALIQVERNERYTIHELLRQFGADKLSETGKLPSIQARHAAFFADFMQERRGAIFGSQQFEALNQIGADFENVRLAWNILVDHQAFDELPKFLNGLYFFLDVRTRSQEAIELFETTAYVLQSIPISDVTDLALARVWVRLAWHYHAIGLSQKSIATAEAALRVFDQRDSPEDRLIAYQCLALNYMFHWDYENTRRMAELGHELARQLGDRYWEATSLIFFSHIARMSAGDRNAIHHSVREARAIYESLGNPWGMVLSYSTEAGSSFAAGDYDQVKLWSALCQVQAKAFGSAFFIGTSAVYLGLVAAWQGDYDEAWASLRQALRVFWDAGLAHFVTGPLLSMTPLLLREDKAELVVEILALTEHYPGYHGHRALFEIDTDRLEAMRQELRTRLGQDRFAAAWARGAKREVSAVVVELLSEN